MGEHQCGPSGSESVQNIVKESWTDFLECGITEGELVLEGIELSVTDVEFLSKSYDIFVSSVRGQAKNRLERVVFESCSFVDEDASLDMAIFLNFVVMDRNELKHLELIDLPQTGDLCISFLDDITPGLPHFLESVTLERVDLRGGNIAGALQCFLAARENFPKSKLKCLKVINCRCDNICRQVLFEVLQDLNALQELQVQGLGGLGDVGFEILADDMVMNHSSRLKYLNVDNSRDLTIRSFLALACLLDGCPGLVTLSLRGCINLFRGAWNDQQQQDHCSTLGHSIQQHRTLQDIRMTGSGMTEELACLLVPNDDGQEKVPRMLAIKKQILGASVKSGDCSNETLAMKILRTAWTSYIGETASDDGDIGLCIENAIIDSRAVQFLMTQCTASPVVGGDVSACVRVEQRKPLEELWLEDCWFENEEAVTTWVHFIQSVIGNELKEFYWKGGYQYPHHHRHHEYHRLAQVLCSLGNAPSLQRLGICGTDFTLYQIDGPAIRSILHGCSSHLKELDLSYCHEIGGNVFDGLLEGLAAISGLVSLNLTCWEITDDSMGRLVATLRMTNLNSLRIALNPGVTAASFPHFAELLSHSDDGCSSNLEELVCDGCPGLFRGGHFNEEQSLQLFQTFTKALARNTSLRTLSYRSCFLNGTFSAPLFQSLESNRTLQALDIQECDNTVELLPLVSKPLAGCLGQIRGLTSLSATVNFSLLSSELETNVSLIHVRGTSFGDESSGSEGLAWIFRRNFLLKNTLPAILSAHISGQLDSTNWPFCAEVLTMSNGYGDVTALYELVRSTHREILSWQY